MFFGEHRERALTSRSLIGFQQPIISLPPLHFAIYIQCCIDNPHQNVKNLGRLQMVMSVNMEGLSSYKQQILAEPCVNHKCDVLCMQETHRGHGAVRHRVNGMNLVAEIALEQYGSAFFIRDSCTCDSTCTSSTDNIEIIQATLNGVSVHSYYKPPNQAFDFRSSTIDTHLQVLIGDFNSHSTEWGYRSTNDDGTLLERWCDVNSLTLIHDPKLPKTFNSARWKQ